MPTKHDLKTVLDTIGNSSLVLESLLNASKRLITDAYKSALPAPADINIPAGGLSTIASHLKGKGEAIDALREILYVCAHYGQEYGTNALDDMFHPENPLTQVNLTESLSKMVKEFEDHKCAQDLPDDLVEYLKELEKDDVKDLDQEIGDIKNWP